MNTVEPCILDQIDHFWSLAMTKPIILSTKGSNMTFMIWATTYPKISFLGQKLWPPAMKRFIFETPFEGPLLPCETDQVPYLCHFSSDQDEIWCVKSPWVALDVYRISSRSAKNWPRYSTLLFII